MPEQHIHQVTIHAPSPISTGGGGYTFQHKVQAFFVIQLFLDGFVPCFPDWPISEIKLQGNWAGYETDDMIVFVTDPTSGKTRRLLCQITQTISFTKGNEKFKETIFDAWRDFNNPLVFQQGEDRFALISGLLSGTACKDVVHLLEIARTSKCPTDFKSKLNTSGICSDGCRDIFGAFLFHLRNANDGQYPEEDVWFSFLRSIHVFFVDFEIQTGINQAVIQTLIGLRFKKSPNSIWDSICNIINCYDSSAGTISKNSEDFSQLFQPTGNGYKPTGISESVYDVSQKPFTQEEACLLVRLALLGKWSETSRVEKQFAFKFLGTDEKEWESRSRVLLNHDKMHLSLRDKTWNCKKRDHVIQLYGHLLIEKDFDKFQNLAILCLSEPDPFVGIDYDDFASLTKADSQRNYSSSFKHCIGESLAILSGARSSFSKNIQRKIEGVCCHVVRTLLHGADWIRWASLSHEMPVLAESAPEVFLDAVEDSLRRSDNPFKPWLSAVCGKNVISGNWTEFVGAFEVLAWNETNLLRCCNALAVFADMAPQMTDWATGPLRTISKILLPWFPQTKAPFEKQSAAVVSISNEHPEIGWKTLLALFPKPGSLAVGCSKPQWNGIVKKDWNPKITIKEYWKQIERYAVLSTKLASGNETRLAELVKETPHLSPRATSKIMSAIQSRRTLSLSECRKAVVWEAVKSLLVSSKRLSDNLPKHNPKLLEQLQKAETLLRPRTPSIFYRRLFTEQPINLFQRHGNWRRESQLLGKQQGKALLRILRVEGMAKLQEIVCASKFPSRIGPAMACVSNSNIETEILQFFLGVRQPNVTAFINGFIMQLFNLRGVSWVDSLIRTSWTEEQTGCFLAALPFEDDTWERLSNWLPEDSAEKYYWNALPSLPYQGKTDFNTVIERLLEHRRADIALEWFSMQLESIASFDIRLIERTLLDFPLKRNHSGPLDNYAIHKMIECLQNSPGRDSVALEEIEWRYLPNFKYNDDFIPRALIEKLSSNPTFFCDVVDLETCSGNAHYYFGKTTWTKREQQERASLLLDKWNLVPGPTTEGLFNPKSFRTWVKRTRMIAKKRTIGNDVEARIGEVLTHAPTDPSGLWIHKEIASLLNQEHSEVMRRHYSVHRFNSEQRTRYNPGTNPNLKRRDICLEQANAIENAGYFRLATELRGLAKMYESTEQFHQEVLGAD